MAPELKLNPPEGRGPKNDVYSVAISFIRLLTGDKDTPQDEIEKLLEEKIENAKIRNILKRGLDKDFNTRASAQELLDLIDESYQTLDSSNYQKLEGFEDLRKFRIASSVLKIK